MRLEQVLVNLLTNAARYTGEGGRVRLRVGARAGWALFAVSDTGIGVAPEMLERVFDLFEQVDPDRDGTRDGAGLGIGLTVVKTLVELQGGRVHARSDGPGRGSEFVVELPLLEADAPEAVREPRAAGRPAPNLPSGPTVQVEPFEGTTAGPRRLLVVDDHPDAGEMLAVLLRCWGHDVELALDGPSALASVERRRPDLVLLDIGLPGMSGYDVAERLRSRPELRDVLLVALTGYGQPEDKLRAARAGFAHHLVKPVDPAALQKLLAATALAVKNRVNQFPANMK
jgi:CheY-like chemotaxis protein